MGITKYYKNQQAAWREIFRSEGSAAVLRVATVEGVKAAAMFPAYYDGAIDALDEVINEWGGDSFLGLDLRDLAFATSEGTEDIQRREPDRVVRERIQERNRLQHNEERHWRAVKRSWSEKRQGEPE